MSQPVETRRALIIGAGGQLGRALGSVLAARGVSVVGAYGREALDLEDSDAIGSTLDELVGERSASIDWVLNAAAMTAVDACEEQIERAQRLNSEAPARLADWCRGRDATLLHVSTDYVFSGEGERPWREEDPCAPLSEYGKSKRAGEIRVLESGARALVVRTAWLFGAGSNFVATILRVARESAGEAPSPLRVVDDQLGSPTYCGDLAEGIAGLLESEARGLYHLANSGVASWWDLARAAVDSAGLQGLPIERVKSDAFPRPAPRPRWSVLDTGKALAQGVAMPSWGDGLRRYLASPESPLRGDGLTE